MLSREAKRRPWIEREPKVTPRVRNTLRRVGGPPALLLAAALWAGLPELDAKPEAAGGKIEALEVTYETRGLLPGDSEGKGAGSHRQVVTIDTSGARLSLFTFEELAAPAARPAEGGVGDPEGSAPRKEAPEEPAARAVDPTRRAYALRQRLILRMDLSPPVIFEILRDGREYREHAGDMNSLQVDRRIAEKNELELVKQYPEKDRRAFFREYWWLRPDGSREVSVDRQPGETRLGRPCERVVIRENGREIIDAQIATDEGGGRSYYNLYRRLGAFSEEVLEKIQDIKGIPLEGRITVVTALPTRKLEVTAISVETVQVPADFFEVPAGAIKVDAVPETLTCASCGKDIAVPVDQVPAKMYVGGRWIYFCSEDCGEEYAQRQVED